MTPDWPTIAPLLKIAADKRAAVRDQPSGRGVSQLDQIDASWRDGLALRGIDPADPQQLFAFIVGLLQMGASLEHRLCSLSLDGLAGVAAQEVLAQIGVLVPWVPAEVLS